MSWIAKWSLGTLCALALVAGVGWLFQEEILLTAIEFAMKRRVPVGPNRPVVWEPGEATDRAGGGRSTPSSPI